MCGVLRERSNVHIVRKYKMAALKLCQNRKRYSRFPCLSITRFNQNNLKNETFQSAYKPGGGGTRMTIEGIRLVHRLTKRTLPRMFQTEICVPKQVKQWDSTP